MRFVLLCDENYMKSEMNNFVNSFPRNHELVTITTNELLETKTFPEGVQGILVERNTWQKAFAMIRYFGLLPLIESVPLAPVYRSRRLEPLKGRSGLKEVAFVASMTPEEVFSTLDRFISLPPVQHQYPRGSALA